MTAIELEHGKSYDCTIDSDSGLENCSLVQLAIDSASNHRFVLLGARYLFTKHSDYVHKLINMSFKELITEDFLGDPDRIMGLQVKKFILNTNGALESKIDDCFLYDFVEIDKN